jgi:chemotaxis signal transduction protein
MEIMRLTQLAPIPQVKAFVRGIASSRGELIPITDLSVFLTKKPPKTSHHSRILVIKNNDQQVGLLVDRVFGLQRMQRDTIAHHTQTGISEINPYIIGTLENPTVELPIISCKKIVKSELFRQTNLVKSQLKDEEGKV